MKHIVWIDYAKGIAIFLVVMLHTHCSGIVSQIIDGFIIPFFLLISGYLFSYERNPSYSGFAYKRFRQLIVPYLWIGALGYLAWLLVLRNFGSDAGSGQSWYEPLLGIVGGIAPLMSTDIPLWFLLSLFMTEVIFYPLNRLTRNPLLIGAAALALNLLLYLAAPSLLTNLPLLMGPTIAGLPYYALGHWLRRHEFDGKRLFNPLMAIFCAGLFYLGIRYNSEVRFYVCEYGNYGFYLLSSLSGSYLAFCLSYLAGRLGENAMVKFISRTTLIVCGLHILIFSFIKGVALFLFHIEPELLTANLLNGTLFALTSFALSLAFGWFISRYFRFLVDK